MQMSDFLITTHADNKHLFDRKGTNTDVLEKNSITFYQGIWCFGEATERGLQTNGTCDKWNALFPNGNSQPKFSDFFFV